jgi:phage baseplate assembly protein W
MTAPRLDPARAVQDPDREPRGFAFPFRVSLAADGGTGGVAWSEGRTKLRDNLMQLLQTNPGERVMRRSYGAGLRDLVHDPNDDVLRALAQHRIGKAIAADEPRIQLQGVNVVSDRRDPGRATLMAELTYEVRRTHQPDLTIVPVSAGIGGEP